MIVPCENKKFSSSVERREFSRWLTKNGCLAPKNAKVPKVGFGTLLKYVDSIELVSFRVTILVCVFVWVCILGVQTCARMYICLHGFVMCQILYVYKCMAAC